MDDLIRFHEDPSISWDTPWFLSWNFVVFVMLKIYESHGVGIIWYHIISSHDDKFTLNPLSSSHSSKKSLRRWQREWSNRCPRPDTTSAEVSVQGNPIKMRGMKAGVLLGSY